jgi:putative flippase GtrA
MTRKSERLAHARSFSWFTFVGAVAGLVHYFVAIGMEASFSLAPAVANTIGFLCAFPVSYLGHQHFSFAARDTHHRQTLPRFLIVACSGFISNQILLLAALQLLQLLHLPFWLALGIVMIIVAALTYSSSHFWAFR